MSAVQVKTRSSPNLREVTRRSGDGQIETAPLWRGLIAGSLIGLATWLVVALLTLRFLF